MEVDRTLKRSAEQLDLPDKENTSPVSESTATQETSQVLIVQPTQEVDSQRLPSLSAEQPEILNQQQPILPQSPPPLYWANHLRASLPAIKPNLSTQRSLARIKPRLVRQLLPCIASKLRSLQIDWRGFNFDLFCTNRISAICPGSYRHDPIEALESEETLISGAWAFPPLFSKRSEQDRQLDILSRTFKRKDLEYLIYVTVPPNECEFLANASEMPQYLNDRQLSEIQKMAEYHGSHTLHFPVQLQYPIETPDGVEWLPVDSPPTCLQLHYFTPKTVALTPQHSFLVESSDKTTLFQSSTPYKFIPDGWKAFTVPLQQTPPNVTIHTVTSPMGRKIHIHHESVTLPQIPRSYSFSEFAINRSNRVYEIVLRPDSQRNISDIQKLIPSQMVKILVPTSRNRFLLVTESGTLTNREILKTTLDANIYFHGASPPRASPFTVSPPSFTLINVPLGISGKDIKNALNISENCISSDDHSIQHHNPLLRAVAVWVPDGISIQYITEVLPTINNTFKTQIGLHYPDDDRTEEQLLLREWEALMFGSQRTQ